MSSSITSPENHHFGYAAWLTNSQGHILVPNAGVTGRYCHAQVLLGTQDQTKVSGLHMCSYPSPTPSKYYTLIGKLQSLGHWFNTPDLLKTFPLSSSTQLILVISTFKKKKKKKPTFFSSLHFFHCQ